MPKRGRSEKRERRYEHITDGLVERGTAARTSRGRSNTTKAELERAVGR